MKRANQILKALLEEYKGAATSPVTLNGNGKPEIASDGRCVHSGNHVEGQSFGRT
jgi:hypothetical protein